MHKVITISLLSSSLLYSQTQPKDFSYFLKSTVENNPEYKATLIDLNIAKRVKKSTKSLYYPSLGASYSRDASESDTSESESNSTSLSLSGSVPQAGLNYSSTLYSNTETTKPSPKSNSGNFNLNLSVKLLRGFGPTVGDNVFKNAKLDYKLAKISRISSLYSIFNSLVASYTTTYTNQENLKLQISSQKKIEKELRKTKDLFEAGKVSKLSLLTLKARMKEIELDITNQKESLRIAHNELKNFVNQSSSQKMNPQLKLISKSFIGKKLINSYLKKKLNFSKLKNIEYINLKAQLEKQKRSLAEAKNNLLPSLDLAYNINGSASGSSRTDLFERETKGNSISLNLSMPLGSIQEKNDHQIAKLNLRKTEYQISRLKLSLIRDWESLKIQYKMLLKRIEITKSLVLAARGKYKASLATSTLGATYQQNIISFQEELIQKETSLNQLNSDLIILKVKVLEFHNSPQILRMFTNI